MKTSEIYRLNKDLDLKNENFIVKKGTQFEIIELFDTINNSLQKKVNVRFDKINGTYLLDGLDFEDQLSKRDLLLVEMPLPKFKMNDCVVHSNHGEGKVEKVGDYDHLIKTYLYRVGFKAQDLVVLETDLSRCK